MIEVSWAIGVILLGIAIFIFATRQRRLKGREREISEQAARENWDKEEIR